jgi:hypothetical protein
MCMHLVWIYICTYTPTPSLLCPHTGSSLNLLLLTIFGAFSGQKGDAKTRLLGPSEDRKGTLIAYVRGHRHAIS